ncbi:MAG TPA: FAD-dependent oxidoreductase [Actinomycetales bacterium]|nr:FAD-dependent oxidoreductase [Actinomycetales bacterium]
MASPRPAPVWQDPELGAPPLGADTRCDVAVVGAGITGLTTAVQLGRAGMDVLLLEARHVGAGTTGGSTAKVTLGQGARMSTLRAAHDNDALVDYVDAGIEGQQWLAELAARRGVPMQEQDGVTYATTEEGRSRLEEELRAMRVAGLEPSLLPEAGLPFDTTGALVLPGQLQIDPGAYARALAREAEEAGVRIHEHSTVHSASWTGPLELRVGVPASASPGGADAGQHRVTANWLVLATGLPILDRGGFFAREQPSRSYCVAVEVRGERPAGMFLSVEQPTRSLRTVGDRGLLVGGNGHVVGRQRHTEGLLDDLELWVERYFDVLGTTHRWAAQDYATADGLPYVGRLLPWREDVLFASGFDKWGMTTGTAAGLALAGAVVGEGAAWASRWDPWRANVVRQLPQVARFNASVAWQLGTGLVRVARNRFWTAPPEGHGVVRPGLRGPVAVSCVDGQVRSVSAVCPHLGGIVQWNDGERSWDCPLHGSRFTPDGSRLEGPAGSGLRQADGAQTKGAQAAVDE